MYFEFNADGKWFLRNDKGQLKSGFYNSFDELLQGATW